MKLIKKILQYLKELGCNHVYIDVERLGFKKCVFCDKVKPKN